MMLALVLTPLTSMAASPLAFNFNCASIGGVNSDGKGNVWIDGGKATVKAFNENYWEATSGKNTVSISRKDDGNPDVSGLDLIVSTGFACRRIILIILQRKIDQRRSVLLLLCCSKGKCGRYYLPEPIALCNGSEIERNF